MSIVAKVAFTDYRTSVHRAMNLISEPAILSDQKLIILKPNLTNSSPPPVTTSPEMVEAVYGYCRSHTSARIVIAEGCGSGRTADVFESLGYAELAERLNIELVDLNDAPTIELANTDAFVLKRFHMPKIVADAFVISIPVLKDHSFTRTTVAMKNMFGIAPGKFYASGWNKGKLHSPSTDKSTVDICTYKKPDLSVVDASVALAGMHLSGTPKKLGVILASLDPVAVDAVASEMMGHDRRDLEYLNLANGLLGDMDNIEIVS